MLVLFTLSLTSLLHYCPLLTALLGALTWMVELQNYIDAAPAPWESSSDPSGLGSCDEDPGTPCVCYYYFRCGICIHLLAMHSLAFFSVWFRLVSFRFLVFFF